MHGGLGSHGRSPRKGTAALQTRRPKQKCTGRSTNVTRRSEGATEPVHGRQRPGPSSSHAQAVGRGTASVDRPSYSKGPRRCEVRVEDLVREASSILHLACQCVRIVTSQPTAETTQVPRYPLTRSGALYARGGLAAVQ